LNTSYLTEEELSMDAMQILVIILSIFLALFLLVGIILVVLLIKVTKQIKKVTSTAQSTVENINNFTANASKFSSPLMIVKSIIGQVKKAKK